MSLPVQLSIVLQTSRAVRRVTAEARDLSFREVVPGGFASCTVPLNRPLTLQPDEIAYYGRMTVYDDRNRSIVWDGRLEDPGRSAGSDGEVWELSAVGPSAHASDRTVPYIMVDRDLSSLFRINNVDPAAQTTVGDDPGAAAGSGSPALVLQFPVGTPINASSSVSMRYGRIWRAGQKLARVDFQWDAGRTDANILLVAACRTDGGGFVGDIARSHAFNTGGGGFSPTVVGTNWTNGRNTLDLLLDSNTIVTPATSDYWASVRDLVILAMRFNADGTEKTTGYTTNTVLASEIVADLLGRLLTQYDGATAAIATTTHSIDQLSYPDGTTARKVFDDLMAFEPDFYWAAWERLPSGKHRFEWRAWSSAVRYDATVTGGYTSTGSADGLYDAVRVRWRDVNGEIRTNRRTQTVPELAAAGITREAFIDLGDEIGSSANANRAGDMFLSRHLSAPNAGRLTITRPVFDHLAGRMVMPWEIRAGYLIRARGILPHVDALNATTNDGVTVFRIVGREYSLARAEATLELDSPPQTLAHVLAGLAGQNARRR